MQINPQECPLGRKRRQVSVVLVLALATGLAGCSGSTAPITPSGPLVGSVPTPNPSLLTVTDSSTGFSTTDFRDADDRIVQITRDDELVITRDNSRLRGYRLAGGSNWAYWIYRQPCVGEECWPWLEIRFGSQAGQPRAYLTADYGHDNPGTLVSLTVVDGKLNVTGTDKFPPGSPTLSGQVTEMTPSGPIPVTGAGVYLGVVSGYRDAVTDNNGFYQIQGLVKTTAEIFAGAAGYQNQKQQLTINGDTRLDFQLVRQ
jgi:Carboxypeptidase regulatory-like domain